MTDPQLPGGAEPPQPIPASFQINLPPDQAEGHYGDFVSVWHNQETFIIDFAAMVSTPSLETDEHGGQVAKVTCNIVTRARIPYSQVWELMKALESQLGAFEREYPHRKPPPENG